MTLGSNLASLEASGLIRVASLRPEIEYLFGHALTQEAAYASLVKADRRRLHLAVGEALERTYPDRLASRELAPLLGQHFAEAGEDERALSYFTLAGNAAMGVFASGEAVMHFARALEIAKGRQVERETLLHLYTSYGHALELSSQDAQALANYEDLEAVASERGDRSMELAALTARATIYVKPSVEQNLALGYDLSQKALGLARELGDRPAEAKVMWNLLQYYWAASKMNEALEYGERALAIAREQDLREQIAYVLTDLLKVYFQTEQPDRGRAALEEAQSIWRELGVLNMLADNLASTSFMHIMAGEYQQALAGSEEALQVSRAIGNLWNQSYSLYTVDLVHFDRGDIGRAIEVGEECLHLAKQAGFAEGVNQTTFDLALIYGYMGALPRAFEAARLMQARADAQAGGAHASPIVEGLIVLLHLRGGRLAEAQAALEEARITEDEAELRQWYPVTHLFVVKVKAELAVATGDFQRAIALTDQTIPYLQQKGVRLFLADLFHSKGCALRAAGRVEEAQAVLAAARAEAEELGSLRILWQILADQAILEAGRRDQQAALGLRRHAAEIIEYIAAHAGAPDLRHSFLNLPHVRAVLQ